MDMAASKRTAEGTDIPPDKNTLKDYAKLSNEALHTALCKRTGNTTFLPVTEDTRETVIAMLRITENDKSG
jgi:hypothetical protein